MRLIETLIENTESIWNMLENDMIIPCLFVIALLFDEHIIFLFRNEIYSTARITIAVSFSHICINAIHSNER